MHVPLVSASAYPLRRARARGFRPLCSVHQYNKILEGKEGKADSKEKESEDHNKGYKVLAGREGSLLSLAEIT